MDSVVVPVILSGGMGTRLWPLSRGDYPKQFLKIPPHTHSLIQETALRVADRAQFAAPVVVCNEEHRFLVAEKLREIGVQDATILLEPCGRNTAPALAAAAHFIRDRYGADALMLVLPSDHIISDRKAFLEGVERACATARNGWLTTFGITPRSAETGYGYIKLGKPLAQGGSHVVAEFVEKPDAETAQSYVQDGGYAWNSGMFCFPAELYLGELEKFRPELAALAEQATLARREDADFLRLDARAFSRIHAESIDYAVMEETERAAVVPLDCGWSDAGSYEALWEMHPQDAAGNAVSGEAYLTDSQNCYVSGAEGIAVATLGVSDLVIVATRDSVLVADKSRSQEVKLLVDQIAQSRPELVEKYHRTYRPWGSYDLIAAGPRYRVKRITVKPEEQLSQQMHHHRAEHWVVVQGTATVECGEGKELCGENQSVYIPLATRHRLGNPGKIPLEVIEVQTGAYFGEDDIVRFDDAYGRTKEDV